MVYHRAGTVYRGVLPVLHERALLRNRAVGADALDDEEVHADWRRDEGQLHVDEHDDIEPDEIEAERLDDRIEHRQRDEDDGDRLEHTAKCQEDDVDADGNVVLSAADKLAEVAVETARTAQVFDIDPKVAVLSFSTKGSGKGATVQLSHDATIKAQELAPDLAIDGELQFDAAVSMEVAKTKCQGSPVAGQANTFIFPCIEAGNIGYKIAQRLGGYAAYGPILQGLNAPINDLSRGCDADEIYYMSIITAALS